VSTAIHGIWGSPYVRSALLGLEEKGVKYEFVPMEMGDHKRPDYLELHPFGRIPVLRHDDFTLYETQAIIRYVDAAFPGEALQPDEPRKKARMDQLVGIVDWYFFPQVTATISFERFIAPRLGRDTNEDVVAGAVPNARTCVAAIDRLAREGSGFLVTDRPTVADLMLAPHLDYFAATPEGGDVLGGYPGLLGWLDRMRHRPSMKNTNPARTESAAS
jgi:glutathione S-transferase